MTDTVVTTELTDLPVINREAGQFRVIIKPGVDPDNPLVGSTPGFYVFRVALTPGGSPATLLSGWVDPVQQYSAVAYDPISRVGVRIYDGKALGYTGSSPTPTEIKAIYKIG